MPSKAAPVLLKTFENSELEESEMLAPPADASGLRSRIRVIASGKLGTSARAAWALCAGADFINSARGFMFALGCIQAQTCHSGHCPTGVTTQDPKRQMALVVPDKAQRVRNFHRLTLESLKELLEAAGLRIVAQKRIHMTTAQAETVYGVHAARPFFRDLVTFMTSGPVVVQVLVPAESAGVLFTRDPLDPGGHRMLAEAAWGLGEAVVSGRVQPDRFTLDRETGAVLTRATSRAASAISDWVRKPKSGSPR